MCERVTIVAVTRHDLCTAYLFTIFVRTVFQSTMVQIDAALGAHRVTALQRGMGQMCSIPRSNIGHIGIYDLICLFPVIVGQIPIVAAKRQDVVGHKTIERIARIFGVANVSILRIDRIVDLLGVCFQIVNAVNALCSQYVVCLHKHSEHLIAVSVVIIHYRLPCTSHNRIVLLWRIVLIFVVA